MSEATSPPVPTTGDATGGRPVRPAPELREMALIGGLAFFLHLFLGTVLQWIDFRWGLLASQVLFIAAPPILAVSLFYIDRRVALGLRRPSGAAVGAAVLGAVGLNWILTLAGELQERVFPTPEPLRRFFEDLLVYRGLIDFVALLLVLAVVPAICEELLFRGFLQTGLVRVLGGEGRGVVVSALLFAAFHLDPWRFTGVFVLGLFLGTLVVRSGSLWPAVVAHAINNTMSIALAAARGENTGSPTGEGLPGGLAGVAAAVASVGVGLWFLRQGRPAAAPGRAAERML